MRPKGFKHSEETKRKIGLANSIALKGIKHTEERKRNKRGQTPWNKGKRGLQVAWNKGKKLPYIMSEETKAKLRKIAIERGFGSNSVGEKNWNWRGGKTKETQRLRATIKYKNWRTAVFQRDNYTCQHCGQRGGYLEADHIKQFAFFPELRFIIDNGRTLCKDCHKKTDTYSIKGKILKTPETLSLT